MQGSGRRYGAIPVLWCAVAACSADREGAGALSERLVTVGSLVISGAVIPAPVIAGDTRASLYLQIHNTGTDPDTLRTLSSPVADSVRLHTMQRDGGMMRMTPLGPLALPAGTTTLLEPGRDHGMLEGLHDRLRVGDTVRVWLEFDRAGSTDMAVPVVAYDAVNRED